MSRRYANPQSASIGASPLGNPGSNGSTLTLSQRLQNTRSELKKRTTEIVTEFVIGDVEPLLEEQAMSGTSKTLYIFIPSGTEQGQLTSIMPEDKDTVEGFGGSATAGPYISLIKYTKEYLKVTRLVGKQYSLEFWQQPGVMTELEDILIQRLRANGERLADNTPDSTGREWRDRSFVDGQTLSPGFTGFAVRLAPSNFNPRVTLLSLYVEIA